MQETENEKEKENKKEKEEREKKIIFADNQSAKFLFPSFKRRRRLVSQRC